MPGAEVIVLSEDEAKRYGGYTIAAKWLAEQTGEPFTRQRVYSLHRWRKGNGFPGKYHIQLPDGRVKDWFLDAEVQRWGEAHMARTRNR
jgi:hypothetical protein